MDSIQVSICIPVYNGGQYLRQCLESCLAQTYTDFEIVVCDDCSTDGSEQIVNQVLAGNPNLKFHRNEKNLGLVGNWNRCIELSTGKWIKMLFQDDYMAPDCLATFIKATQPVPEAPEATGSELLVSRRHFVFGYEPPPAEKRDYARKSELFDNWSEGRVALIPPDRIAAYAATHININFIGEPSLTFFLRKAAIKVGLFDPDFLQVCDLDFLLRLSAEKGLTYVPDDICFFRLHKEATTNVNMGKRAFELRYLEPLLMAANLLAGDAYTPLRKNMSHNHLSRIRLYLNTRLSEAQIVARSTENHQLLSDYLVRNKIITAEAKPNLFHKLVFYLLRLRRLAARLRRGS